MTNASNAADLAFLGGVILTPSGPVSGHGVAVSGGIIQAVDTAENIRPRIGPNTRLVDLDGRLLLPGFQDAHVHVMFGGLAMIRCELHHLHSIAAYADAIAAYAASAPDVDWIQGGGWAMSVFPSGSPTKETLDAVISERPVCLISADGHSAWVNSKALEIAGVMASTPEPPDGLIDRDASGAPSGTLHEGAVSLVSRFIPPISPDEGLRGLLTGQEYLHSVGITAWQDAIVDRGIWAENSFDVYLRADAEKSLTGRVVGALWWDHNRGMEQIAELEEMRAESLAQDGLFRATSVKFWQDGIVENFTGSMLSPYLDASGLPTRNTGKSMLSPDELDAAVTALDSKGFQVHIHAIGDRAVREALDAFESAISANGRSDNRHHIAHIQVIHPDDVPRFASLGVTANMQAFWACHEDQMDEMTIPFLGQERSGWQYPFADLVRTGARLCMGSDWSVSTADPFQQMHVAVNRVAPDDPGREAFLPEQRISLETAVEAFTEGSAFINHLEESTGSISVGKAADLVVADRDVFSLPTERICETAVDMTFVAGQAVFERSPSY